LKASSRLPPGKPNAASSWLAVAPPTDARHRERDGDAQR
jgi:hypothetical protein